MGNAKISVVSGQMSFSKMTLDLWKNNKKEFDIRMIRIWLNMLNDGMNPVKFLKPNKNGTKVNFECIKDEAGYFKGLAELTNYITEVNKEHGTDIKLKTTEGAK